MIKKKFFFSQIKLAYIIPLIFFSTTSYPAYGRSQLTESTSDSFRNERIYFARPPKLPDNGTPTGRRRGGTSRNDCPALNTPLTALVPGIEENSSEFQNSTSFLASTVAEYPTFWVYIPKFPDSVGFGEFVLQDEAGNDVFRTSLRLPKIPGLIGISLPSNPQYALKINKKYHWYFRVFCNKSQTEPKYFYVDAWVKRIAIKSEWNIQLRVAEKKEYLVYAENNVWYDAVTNLASQRRNNLENDILKNDWAILLKSVGLQNLTEKLIVKQYSFGNQQ